MLSGQQRDEFDRYGIVRMPGAVGKAAADEMLATVWDALRDRYHLHRGAPETWPEPGSGLHRLVVLIGFWGRITCPSR